MDVGPTPARRATAWLSRRWWALALGLVFLYAFPHYPRIQSANELPRVYLVVAMVDDGTFAIDHGVKRWGPTADVSPSNGHQYSRTRRRARRCWRCRRTWCCAA